MGQKGGTNESAKLTLLLNAHAIQKGKSFSKAHGISLSRLVEFFFNKADEQSHRPLNELPMADWVLELINSIPASPSKKTRAFSNAGIRTEHYEGRHGNNRSK